MLQGRKWRSKVLSSNILASKFSSLTQANKTIVGGTSQIRTLFTFSDRLLRQKQLGSYSQNNSSSLLIRYQGQQGTIALYDVTTHCCVLTNLRGYATQEPKELGHLCPVTIWGDISEQERAGVGFPASSSIGREGFPTSCVE